MNLGNLFRGIVAQVNPFDGGKNFRTYNPRKRREDEQQTTARSSGAPQVITYTNTERQAPEIKVQSAPQNLFQDLNKSLALPGSQANKVDVKKPSAQALSEEDKKMVEAYNNPTNMRAYDQSRKIFESILNDPNNKDHERAKRLAPHIRRNRLQENLRQTAKRTGGFAKDLAMTPIEVARDVPKAVIRASNQIRGKEDVDVGDFWGKVLNAEDNKVGNFSNYGRETRQGVSGMVGKVSAGDSKYDPVIGGALSVLDATPLGGVLAGVRVGSRNGLRAGIRRSTGSRNVLTDSDVGGVPEAELSAGARRINVTQVRDVPVADASGEVSSIPVRTTGRTSRPIRDVSGDTPGVNQVDVPTPNQRAQERFNNQPAARPDRRVDGVVPGAIAGDATVYTKYEVDVERAALDDALAKGEINKTQHKAANKELDDLPVVEPGTGRKIEIKESKSIPVEDRSTVPTDTAEVPGTVRATATADANQARTERAAQAPVVVAPETQAILDNPKNYTKAQVARAKEQAKLARKYQKQQEDAAAALVRAEQASPRAGAPSEDGLAPTGVLRVGRAGQVYEAGSRKAEAALAQSEMALRSADDLIAELSTKPLLGQADSRKILEAIDRIKQIDPDNWTQNPDFRALDNLRITANQNAGQQLGLIAKVARRTASSDQLTERWRDKVTRAATDRSVITNAELEEVRFAENAYTTARETARAAEEQFRRTGSKADLEKVKAALKEEERLDLEARTTQARVAERALRGDKGSNAAKVKDDLKREADLNMMNAPTSSQLSGPATAFRNLFGTEAGGIENRIGANIRAGIIHKLTGQNVGGYSRSGARDGRVSGMKKFGEDFARRQEFVGKNPVKFGQNFATTANSLGESSMAAQTQAKLGAYYLRQAKQQGATGEQAKIDAEFLRLTDPDGMQPVFMDSVMKSSGLQGIYQKSKQIENNISDWMTSNLEVLVPPRVARGFSNFVTRIALGYPTATGNFVLQSSKRLALGLPTAAEAGLKLARGDKAGAAMALDSAMKEAGSGSAMWMLGAMLGSAGMVSGSYPDAKEERERWEREGIIENAIRIGDAWYPIPQGLGMFGLPIMTAAALGRGGPEELANMYQPKNISKLLPTDQVQGFLTLLSGGGSEAQEKNFVASTIRTGVPLGSFFNQLARGLDPTKNDTTTKSFMENVIDAVVSGIPGHHLVTDIPDRTDVDGNVIENPNVAQIFTGASSKVQQAGLERSAEIRGEVNSNLEAMSDLGAFSDPNLAAAITDSATLKSYNDILAGKDVNPADVRRVQSAMVKGVSQEGGDTAYLERGEYDSHLAALKLKRQLMEADSTIAPSKFEKMDISIKRAELYKEMEIPYDSIKAYQDTNLTEWRNMGNPEHDDYNPEAYQALWAMDEMMAKAGVSYAKGNLEKQKYYAKNARSGGRGGSGGRTAKMSTEFGKLGNTRGAPEIRAYESISQQTGSVPVIRTVRPNIVHKISSSG